MRRSTADAPGILDGCPSVRNYKDKIIAHQEFFYVPHILFKMYG